MFAERVPRFAKSYVSQLENLFLFGIQESQSKTGKDNGNGTGFSENMI